MMDNLPLETGEKFMQGKTGASILYRAGLK